MDARRSALLVALVVGLTSIAVTPASTPAPREEVAAEWHPPSTEARVVPATAPHSSAVVMPTTTAQPPATTTTQPTPTTQPAAPQGDVEDAIARAFGPAYHEAMTVARCESGLNPSARNGVHVGLFQLSGTYHRRRAARLGFTWEQVSSQAWPNAAVAADLYREQSWRPWTCKP